MDFAATRIGKAAAQNGINDKLPDDDTAVRGAFQSLLRFRRPECESHQGS